MRTLSPPWRRVLIGSWIMILTLAVATLVLYVDNKRTKECIGTYMRADSASSQARVKATDQEREAFKGTLNALVNPSSSPASRSEAIRAYIQLLDENDKIRKANPVQPVPTECD